MFHLALGSVNERARDVQGMPDEDLPLRPLRSTCCSSRTHTASGVGTTWPISPIWRLVGSLSTRRSRGVEFAACWRRASYRLCRNYTDEQVCNWACPPSTGSSPPSCALSCRLTRVIPDLDRAGSSAGLGTVSKSAKRGYCHAAGPRPSRCRNRDDDPGTTAAGFDFKADPANPATAPVLTGHADGVITISARGSRRCGARAAADGGAASRIEPCRATCATRADTTTGRCLVRDRPPLDEFRRLFGDERSDYADALKHPTTAGSAPGDWQARFVSAYASTPTRGRTGPKRGRTTSTCRHPRDRGGLRHVVPAETVERSRRCSIAPRCFPSRRCRSIGSSRAGCR